ncbi:uncharacterized protein LOC143223375 [Tachypleus tridentatus]|uniref:uncharacterized protein LOC143223375 n=1 Tax=Tachypleus tridentatus TaxID=6853 RepID=UPI003FD297C2
MKLKVRPGTEELSEECKAAKSLQFLIWSLRILGIHLKVEENRSGRFFKTWKIWTCFIWLLLILNFINNFLTMVFTRNVTGVIMAILNEFGIVVWGISLYKLNKFSKELLSILSSMSCNTILDFMKYENEPTLKVKYNLIVFSVWCTSLWDFLFELLYFPNTNYSIKNTPSNITSINVSKTEKMVSQIIKWYDYFIYDFVFCPSLFFPVVLYGFYCIILGDRFKHFNDYVTLKTSDITACNIRYIRKQHGSLCTIVNELNDAFSGLTLLWYIVIIFNFYSFIYFIIDKVYNFPVEDMFYVMGPYIPVLINIGLIFILLSESASRVSREAHALFPVIYRFTETDSFPGDTRLYRELLTFITRLSNPMIGLSVGDAFIITRGFTFSVIGVVVTFLVILLQMNPEMKNIIGI